MRLEVVINHRLKGINNELARGHRQWKRLNRVMSQVRKEFPAISDWDNNWHHPYEEKWEYKDAQREIYNIIGIEIKLKEEKRYLHDLVRKSKK